MKTDAPGTEKLCADVAVYVRKRVAGVKDSR